MRRNTGGRFRYPPADSVRSSIKLRGADGIPLICPRPEGSTSLRTMFHTPVTHRPARSWRRLGYRRRNCYKTFRALYSLIAANAMDVISPATFPSSIKPMDRYFLELFDMLTGLATIQSLPPASPPAPRRGRRRAEPTRRNRQWSNTCFRPNGLPVSSFDG